MRYLIGLLITIAVIIFIIIRLLSGGSDTPGQPVPELADYASTDTVVRMIVANSVQAIDMHRRVEITVGRDSAEFVLFRGYDGEELNSKRYGMNEQAYESFLRALDISGRYTEGNPDPDLEDERGYCAIGSRYVFEIVDGDGEVIQHYWSTSCGPKTFDGDTDTVRQLFELQIPDYDDLLDDVDI